MSRSVLVEESAAPAQARFAREHDSLATLLEAKLVENSSNVVANRFLRKPERRGDLGVVETLGDAFKHSTLDGNHVAAAKPTATGPRA